MTHNEMIKQMLQNPSVKAEYDALEMEFALFDELLQARHRAGLTQAEVAERMAAKTPAVAQLESSGSGNKHFPSIAAVIKYANAVNCRLDIKLIPH
ncbi:MAG TPA: XRE family transcriptional regulator [Thioploca sp.]|nr:MAG: transcriptional regulator [Gammaproteobacteria bacterium]HDN25951.1 XRE family transcriptional regulator [Thioploca sp.]